MPVSVMAKANKEGYIVTQIRITKQVIEVYNHLTHETRVWERENPMAKAIRERLNPQYLWMTPKDTLIRELFYHGDDVQKWLTAYRVGEQVRPITIRILDDDGLCIVKG